MSPGVQCIPRGIVFGEYRNAEIFARAVKCAKVPITQIRRPQIGNLKSIPGLDRRCIAEVACSQNSRPQPPDLLVAKAAKNCRGKEMCHHAENGTGNTCIKCSDDSKSRWRCTAVAEESYRKSSNWHRRPREYKLREGEDRGF